MAKVRVVLKRRGVRELLKSDAVAGACKAQADAIRDRCGDGYESDVYTGKNRVNAMVWPESAKARQDNSHNNTILRRLK